MKFSMHGFYKTIRAKQSLVMNWNFLSKNEVFRK